MKNLTIVIIITLFTFSLSAQKIISSKEINRMYDKNRRHLWFHDGKEINRAPYALQSKYGNIELVDGKEILIKTFDVNFKTEAGTAYVSDYLFNKEDMATVNTVKDNITKVYIQRYDYEFNKLGDSIKITELAGELHPTSGRKYKYMTFNIDTYRDEGSKTTLLKCRVYNPDFDTKSYLRLLILDENYNIVYTYEQEVKDKENSIDMLEYRILDNGEVFFIVAESDKEFLQGLDLIHFNGNQPERIELVPDQAKILSTNLSTNSYGNKLIVSLLAKDEDHKKNNRATLTVYDYDFQTETMDRQSYQFDSAKLMPDFGRGFGHFVISKVQFLKDGSGLFFLGDLNNKNESINSNSTYYYDRNMMILKINKEGEMEWINVLKRNTSSLKIANLNDCIDYITEDETLEIVFNGIEKDFVNGIYSPKLGDGGKQPLMFAVRGVTPVKATIDLFTGDMQVKKIDFKNDEVYALLLSDAQKTDKPGEYIMKLLLNNSPSISVIDFKED